LVFKNIFILFLSAIAINTVSAQSWVYLSSLPSPDAINSISVVDQNVIWVCGDATACYRSTNGGYNWIAAYTGLPGGNLYGISAIDENTCWVGTVGGSIYKTTNGGTSWTLQQAVQNSFINGIHMFNANFGVYIGDPPNQTGQPYQFRRTTNGGTNWVLSPTAPISSTEFGVINAWDWLDTATFWCGSANTTPNASSAKVYRTTTGFFGTWSYASLTGTGGANGLYYQAIGFINATSGLAGSNASVIMKTTDGGVTWSPTSNLPGVTSYAVINMNAFKDASGLIRVMENDAAGSYKMFRTTNLGTTWTQETLPTQGTTNGIQHMQFISQNLGYGGGNAGVFLRWGPPVGVEPVSNNTPSSYVLEQNYPNPFNPTTTVKFSLPKSSFVTLKIYDAIGNEVKTVVNENRSTGNYLEYIDMSSYSSGIYFYTLKAGDFTRTKKMIMIK
jgi:photosystem II stability/assembly factor-like uncharacterized protein